MVISSYLSTLDNSLKSKRGLRSTVKNRRTNLSGKIRNICGRKSILLLDGSQEMPACPSDKV
jgi:hypothetical protein